MIRHHRLASERYVSAEPNVDDLVLRIRKLVMHRGFDRSEIDSPLLKRLTPNRRTHGEFPETDLRKRLKDAQLDGNTLSYLLRSVEAELDFARLRLT